MLAQRLDINASESDKDAAPAIMARIIAGADAAKDRNRFHDSAGDDADGDGEKRHIQKCTCRVGKKSRRWIMSRMHKLFRHRLRQSGN